MEEQSYQVKKEEKQRKREEESNKAKLNHNTKKIRGYIIPHNICYWFRHLFTSPNYRP